MFQSLVVTLAFLGQSFPRQKSLAAPTANSNVVMTRPQNITSASIPYRGEAASTSLHAWTPKLWFSTWRSTAARPRRIPPFVGRLPLRCLPTFTTSCFCAVQLLSAMRPYIALPARNLVCGARAAIANV
ncbi:hypothetical protein K470DRAFT_79191 [Piedraia hortae CBS 480.64]|uniref:Uncharacterized protein n=1 Tax=Piedraia hortae CBS 480.64 TaxID=1314780 RepID=A0A6A7BXI4_9PEZI|nr:hypothetical protein K470DRAFT_79191 [Piedraia hortae CBS 480.64]